MTASLSPAEQGGFDRLLRSEYFVLILAVGCFLILAPFAPGLATTGNLESILTLLLPLLLLSVGQSFVLLTGGIDLSIASTVGLTSVLGALAVNLDQGWFGPTAWAVPASIALMVAAGIGVGLLNGLAVVALRMPAFIVTLTSMMFVGGCAIWLTQSKGVGNLPASFNALGGRTAIALPLTVLAAAAAHLALGRTLFGRWLYAVGHNSRTARVSGVPTAAVAVAAYALSGLFAAFASVLLTGQAETGSPVAGQRLLLDAIAAAVIGGVSLFGGKGTIQGVFFGVLFVRILDNSLNLIGLSYFAIMIVKGCAIVFAAWLDAWKTRRPLVRSA